MAFLGFYNFLVYIQGYAIGDDIIDQSLGVYLLSMLNAASTVDRVIANPVADLIDPLNVHFPAVMLTVISFVWIRVGTSAEITIPAIFTASFQGAMSACHLWLWFLSVKTYSF